jgi:hypothetical protein
MYGEDTALEYTEDGTMGQTLERQIDKAIVQGDGMLPDPASHPQIISPATMENTSDYNRAAWHTLSSLDGEAGAQLAQIYPAQPTLDGVSPSTLSNLDFQTTVNYPGSHHQAS